MVVSGIRLADLWY